ncbi:unnamed protein product [Penicillium pancosmium]
MKIIAPGTQRVGPQIPPTAPVPPPAQQIDASNEIKWGNVAPHATQQLAKLNKEQARTFINQWKGCWDARVAQFKTRVDNAQATLAQNRDDVQRLLEESANISGNIAAARAAAAGTGEDLELTAYLSDLDDQQERDQLSSLLESSEEESPAPTAETKAHMEEARAVGGNLPTEGGTSDSDDDQPRAKGRPTSARKTGSARK